MGYSSATSTMRNRAVLSLIFCTAVVAPSTVNGTGSTMGLLEHAPQCEHGKQTAQRLEHPRT